MVGNPDDDIRNPFSFDNLEELLISKLILQTGDTATETSQKRWKKHFTGVAYKGLAGHIL